MSKPHLLVISHVLPFPGSAGQQRRVRYKLEAFRERFHVTFMTFAPSGLINEVKNNLSEYCDGSIVLPSRYGTNTVSKRMHRILGYIYSLTTGLKTSNYRIGKLEFAPERIARLPGLDQVELVVYEYWHAVDSTGYFQSRGIPCVLDMHDLLWKSYQRQLQHKTIPNALKERLLRQYRTHEHNAWKRFDALIAINQAEYDYVRTHIPDKLLFYAPMGIDVEAWRYSWAPSNPPRIAYYGNLKNPYNQIEALQCYNKIMPHVWNKFPQTEFWIIGAGPPAEIQTLASNDPRVRVPGYLDDIQTLLKTMHTVICPFEGQFGFRSRLIEAMALGVPVAATHNAVHGMNIIPNKGIFLSDNNVELGEHCLSIIGKSSFAIEQSHLARQQVTEQFSFEMTYGNLTKNLAGFVSEWSKKRG